MAALSIVLSEAKVAQEKASLSNDPTSPWNSTNAWRLNEAHTQTFIIAHNDTEYTVEVEQKREANRSYYLITVDGDKSGNRTLDCQGRLVGDSIQTSIDGYKSTATIVQNGNEISLYRQNGVFNFIHVLPDLGDSSDDDAHGGLTAPMNGTMVAVLVKAGESVNKDQPLVIMEAMKMEHTIRAPSNGTINSLYFAEGEMVDGGAELLDFTAEESK
jgi:3-methylcrotonyl-CoA carboxylase alpha subunit